MSLLSLLLIFFLWPRYGLGLALPLNSTSLPTYSHLATTTDFSNGTLRPNELQIDKVKKHPADLDQREIFLSDQIADQDLKIDKIGEKLTKVLAQPLSVQFKAVTNGTQNEIAQFLEKLSNIKTPMSQVSTTGEKVTRSEKTGKQGQGAVEKAKENQGEAATGKKFIIVDLEGASSNEGYERVFPDMDGLDILGKEQGNKDPALQIVIACLTFVLVVGSVVSCCYVFRRKRTHRGTVLGNTGKERLGNAGKKVNYLNRLQSARHSTKKKIFRAGTYVARK